MKSSNAWNSYFHNYEYYQWHISNFTRGQFPFSSLVPYPLEAGPLNPTRESGGSAVSCPPAESGAQPQPKSNLMHCCVQSLKYGNKKFQFTDNQLTNFCIVWKVKCRNFFCIMPKGGREAMAQCHHPKYATGHYTLRSVLKTDVVFGTIEVRKFRVSKSRLNFHFFAARRTRPTFLNTTKFSSENTIK